MALNQAPLAVGREVYLDFNPASCRLSAVG